MQRTRNLKLYLPSGLTKEARANLLILDDLGVVLRSLINSADLLTDDNGNVKIQAASGQRMVLGAKDNAVDLYASTFTVTAQVKLQNPTNGKLLNLHNISDTNTSIAINVTGTPTLNIGEGEFTFPDGGGNILTTANVSDTSLLGNIISGLVGRIFIKTEYIRVTEDVLTAGGVTLQYAPTTNDIAVDIRGGLSQYPEYDFILSSTMLVFRNHPMEAVLRVGDVLRIMYNVYLS